MSEPGKVRLVRCPKCQNLLPEITNYSVYQCGGCGAVLRANIRNTVVDSISEKSDEDRVLRVSEEPNKGMANLRVGSDEVLSDPPENFRYGSNTEPGKWVVDEFGNPIKGEELEELKPQIGVVGSRRTRKVPEMRNPRMDVEGVRYSGSRYPEDGPSNNPRSGLAYNYEEPMKSNWKEPDRFNKFEYLEEDRAVLLRKLDELTDQLSHSRELNGIARGKVPVDPRRMMGYQDPYNGSDAWFPDGSIRTSEQYNMPNRHVPRPPYSGNYPETSPYTNRNELPMHNLYTNTTRSEMLRRNPHQQPSNAYFPGHYMDNDMDQYETYPHPHPHPHHLNLHPPSCSCIRCYSNHRQIPGQVPIDPMFYPQEKPGSYVPRDYDRRTVNPLPLNSHNLQSHTRWPSDVSSEVGGFAPRRPPPRVVLATRGRRCRPIAGGAPFMTCYNCFELLQLPKNVLLVEKNQKKVRCGGCSTVILVAMVNKKLVSMNAETIESPTKVDDVDVAVNSGTSHSHGHGNQAGVSFSSDDYDDSGFDFQSMDKEPTSSVRGKSSGSGSDKPMEMRSHHSTTPSTSESDDSPDISIEVPTKANSSPIEAGSPHQDQNDYSSKSRAINRLEKGNQSGRSDQVKVMPKKDTSRQNSVKEASLATEMELSSNEYAHTGVSQDSGDANIEEDQLRANKGVESFFAGIIKKSFRSSQSLDHGKIDVTVNGHPLTDRLVKKAEKLAGPVHPGQYWYDFRGGFWGVIGGPCIGIVPPFIEEFNFPMPEKCAGGNTGVFVNGRELHQKDLELLGSRGLPTAKGRSYIVEISGRVLDENSGEELDSLGKLAPTVEKVRHGFGMKTPRSQIRD